MRTGLLAQKLGMTRIFGADGAHIPVTILKAMGNQVVGVKTSEKDGYDAVQVGYGSRKPKKVSKPQKEFYAKKKIEPKKALKEFRVSADALLNQGDEISVNHFVVGQKVDVAGKSIGKGFAGAMKRHNFAGLEATHGVSISHRSHGSTGHCQEPGRVFKGKKMAGQMGNKRVTKQNLEVVFVDEEQGIIAVKGAVPGGDSNIIEVTDAIKSKLPEGLPFPAAIVGGNDNKEPEAQEEAPKQEEAAKAEAPAEEVKEEKAEEKQEEANKEEANKEAEKKDKE